MVRITQSIEVRPPAWQWRVAVTLLILLIAFVAGFAWSIVQGNVDANAVKQLSDNAEDVLVGQAVALSNISGAITAVTGFLLFFLWLPYGIRLARYLQLAQESANRD